MLFGSTHLKYMFEGICYFVPFIDKMLMPLTQDQVQILVFFSWDDTIVNNAFLVLSHHTPAIAMQSFQKSEACSV